MRLAPACVGGQEGKHPMGTSIVKARHDHASFIAWVMLTAFRSHGTRGLWDIFLDADESQCLRYLEALTTSPTPHWAHFSSFLVAEVDGTPGAALSGYFEEDFTSYSIFVYRS